MSPSQPNRVGESPNPSPLAEVHTARFRHPRTRGEVAVPTPTHAAALAVATHGDRPHDGLRFDGVDCQPKLSAWSDPA